MTVEANIGTQLHALLGGHFHGFRRRPPDDGYNLFVAHCNFHDVMCLSRPEWEMATRPTYAQYALNAELHRRCAELVLGEEVSS